MDYDKADKLVVFSMFLKARCVYVTIECAIYLTHNSVIYLLHLLKDSDSGSDVSCNIVSLGKDSDTDTNVVPGPIQSSWPGDTKM